MKYLNIPSKKYREMKQRIKLLNEFEDFVAHRELYGGKSISIKIIKQKLA